MKVHRNLRPGPPQLFTAAGKSYKWLPPASLAIPP